ncbi:DUF4190 domain-containing protein [uncultured Clostridium sp.]|uniref:DUF4190 domain-containing protein n=1 Tax=uncultured Clostridium sp. TaxID=59620 RepID=UPI0025CD69F8|nr:DUF4190 domain-containing protein [uncultured Clostridium sp.]
MQKNSGMAIASMVLGILGIFFSITFILSFLGVILALVGLVLGIVSKSQIEREKEILTGRGMAMAGIICSSIALGLVVLIWVGCAAMLKMNESTDYYYLKLILSQV